MPTLKRFKIKRFRGIQHAEINVDVRKRSDVVTLIGLNESGKTTILEALSHFSTGDRTIANLVGALDRNDHFLSLIPIDRRAAFSGDVRIEADIGFEPGEFDTYLQRATTAMGGYTKQEEEVREINVAKAFRFKDSAYSSSTNYWTGVEFQYRETKKSKFAKIEASHKVWQKVISLISEDLYEIVYFPTFIVEMPSRIYLEEHADETPINLYYRNVINDILKSIGDDLEIKKHVVERLKEHKTKTANASWFQKFWMAPERKIVDAVFHKIEQAINREVIGSWEKIFKHPANSRSVKVEWNVDSSRGDMPFISFGISDGDSVFSVHERSLGFRWFFSYLLFTQFRSRSGRKTIFLFDEPAANLHAKAQNQLLDSIARIVSGGNKVIYSTHSPHMINPSWLGDAVIVENVAVNLDKGDDLIGLDTLPTNIKAVNYGQFVSEYPDKTTYFQPVWEKLLYETPPLVGAGPFLCVEGISDFHFLSIVKNSMESTTDFSIVPGVGAGGFKTTLPTLYGKGTRFILLLDDDPQGRAEKKRYVDDGILAPTEVFTVGDISERFFGKKLETLMGASISSIKTRFNGKSGKKQIGMYLAEAAARNHTSMLHPDTIADGREILEWFVEKVASQDYHRSEFGT